MIQERHILLLSDDPAASLELKKVLEHHHPEVQMKIVENFQQRGLISRKRLPGLIILMFTRSANSHIEFLKQMRDGSHLKEIPVFVYRSAPDKQEMDELIREINRAD